MKLDTFDLSVFTAYLVAMIGIAIWFAVRFKSKDAEDYFLAGKNLPWWAVGGSLIASNISAEQMIGMAGSGFVIGLAISSYELMAAATLIVVAKFFLPVFLRNNIYTMPQFIDRRFDGRVRTGLAIFWVMLFVFVNITSLLFLGGLAMNNILGVPISAGVVALAIYSATFSIFGGLRVVVWTDVIQVVVLILGGTVASYVALNALSDGQGVFSGLQELYNRAPEKFNMIFSKEDTYTDMETGKEMSAYQLLPGLGVLIGGMWIANLYYWGINQYIIQRALAAKSTKEAQNGMVFAAFIKVLMPFIVVLPGIVAYVMQADIGKADEAYPWILSNFVGSGFRGLAVAALVAAIGSSLSSMINSTSTIYTLDIHKVLFAPKASQKQLVIIGRVAASLSLVIGVIMTPLLDSFGQIFQFIQEYTGFISPGILAIFVFGLFWKKTTTPAAFAAVLVAIPLSVGLKIIFPEWAFLNRMGVAFIVLSLIIILISLFYQRGKPTDSVVVVERSMFETGTVFNLMSIVVIGLLAVVYALFW